MLVLVREFDDRMGWAKWGYSNCAEWLSWRCGISLSAAREKVRTAQALRDLPDALEHNDVAESVGDASQATFQGQQADALVEISRAYLDGGSADSSSTSAADRHQVVVHVDEAALHGGVGRADVPLETIKRLACDCSVVVVTEDERGTPLDVGRKQRIVSTPLRRAVAARDRHCTFPGCTRTRYVEAHHVQHWIDGGDTSIDNLVLLCCRHHRLLHEGGYRIRRDYQGEHYFVRADGRAIPRCGYRADDFSDDAPVDDPHIA